MKTIILSFLLIFFGFLPVRAENNLSFCEVLPNPDGTDTKENEYIKLRNNSAAEITLTGWKFCNIKNECYELAGSIGADSCLKIFRQEFLFTLHNDKEELKLYDGSGNTIDTAATKTAPSGKAWLCSQNSCRWDAPQEKCDYQDPIPENENVNADSLTAQEDDGNKLLTANQNANANKNSNTNKNSNSNKSSGKKANLKITSTRDWTKAEREMYEKNLLSLPVDLKGRIAIPLNLTKINYFSAFAGGKLIQINLYASRKEEFIENKALYKLGTSVKIKNGFLKNNGQGWIVGIGKGTSLNISPEKNPTGHKNLTFSRNEDIKRREGKTGEIAGKILKKSGDYFFIAPEEHPQETVSVFVPKAIWSWHLIRQNIGPFPQLENGKIRKLGDYKGKDFRAWGVAEASGDTSRIVALNAANLSIRDPAEDKKDNSGQEDNPGEKDKNLSIQTNTAQATQKTNADSAEKPQENQTNDTLKSNGAELLKTALSQKLDWKMLSAIAWQKIKREIINLF
ncbi:MAG: lamin tail domain-containing protein [Candidatus Moranbacteria bacterium]|nr:lamin tail domain-containing protein [Candidatus Moranbacteria bacterium]